MFRWVEHTAELELELTGPAKADIFAEALTAFAELAGGDGGPVANRELEVAADEDAILLVEWLGELVYLSETEGFVPERIVSLELDDGRLRASIEGREAQPRPLVKGVTLHRLEFRPDGNGWRARVVLDV